MQCIRFRVENCRIVGVARAARRSSCWRTTRWSVAGLQRRLLQQHAGTQSRRWLLRRDGSLRSRQPVEPCCELPVLGRRCGQRRRSRLLCVSLCGESQEAAGLRCLAVDLMQRRPQIVTDLIRLLPACCRMGLDESKSELAAGTVASDRRAALQQNRLDRAMELDSSRRRDLRSRISAFLRLGRWRRRRRSPRRYAIEFLLKYVQPLVAIAAARLLAQN